MSCDSLHWFSVPLVLHVSTIFSAVKGRVNILWIYIFSYYVVLQYSLQYKVDFFPTVQINCVHAVPEIFIFGLKCSPLPWPRRPLMLHLFLLLSYFACHSKPFSVSAKMCALSLFYCCLPNLGDHFLFSLTSHLVSHLSNPRLRATFFSSHLYISVFLPSSWVRLGNLVHVHFAIMQHMSF